MFDVTNTYAVAPTPTLIESGKSATSAGSWELAEDSTSVVPAASKPIVTWRVTQSCNLNCSSCLSDSRPRHYESELTTAQGLDLIKDLAGMRVPRPVFAGGEPLLRADLVEFVQYAREMGIEPSIFTNGSMLSLAMAARLKDAGVHTVTILLEGIGRDLDRNRRAPGALRAVIDGVRNCESAGLTTEIRIPLNRSTFPQLTEILDFVERLDIRGVVFSHLVYAGRGNKLQSDLTHEEKRHALDLIFDRAEDLHRRGVEIRIATDENHVDGIYQFLRLNRKAPLHAAEVFTLLAETAANVAGAGVGIAGIDAVGDVHPDHYWTNYRLGNVRETLFSEIWEKSTDPLLRGLRDRLPLLKGRCAKCLWKEVCGGNLRVRAEECFGDPWTADPACYLTNQEISKDITQSVEAMEDEVLLLGQAA